MESEGQRDFIHENKMDATVWRDLDHFQKTEIAGINNMRVHQTLERKQKLDQERRKELE